MNITDISLNPQQVARNSQLALLDADLATNDAAYRAAQQVANDHAQSVRRIKLAIAAIKFGIAPGVLVTWTTRRRNPNSWGWIEVAHEGKIFSVHPDCAHYGTDKIWVHERKKDGTFSRVEKTLYRWDKWKIVQPTDPFPPATPSGF